MAYVETTTSKFPSPSSAYLSPRDPTFDLNRHNEFGRFKIGAGHIAGDSHAEFTAGSGLHEGGGGLPSASNSSYRNAGSPSGDKWALLDVAPRMSIMDYFPMMNRLSLGSGRPAPLSPSPSSRRQPTSGVPLVSSKVVMPTPIAALPNTDTSEGGSQSIELKILDYGYPEGDARREYVSTLNLHETPRPPSPASLGFLAPMTMDEMEEHEATSHFASAQGRRSIPDTKGGWLLKDPLIHIAGFDEEDSSFHLDEGTEFVPGVYKALYAFEPEGTAEMALEEEMEVTCLGRGGGDGWLIAVKEVTREGEVIHALVPESYMQLIRSLSDDELATAMGDDFIGEEAVGKSPAEKLDEVPHVAHVSDMLEANAWFNVSDGNAEHPSISSKEGWTMFITVAPREEGLFRKDVDGVKLCGGFSDVWQGEAMFSNERVLRVAVKELRAVRVDKSDERTIQEKLLKRLNREIDIWMTLDHQNITPLLGYVSSGEVCLISPWYANGNLAAYIDRHPEADRIELVANVASGLNYLHSRPVPIVHGDLKPDNILIDETGNPMIIDFGLSSFVEGELSFTAFTSASLQNVGNIRWMAPELSTKPGTKRSLPTDVYSFGSLALYTYTGELPFKNIQNQIQIIVTLMGEAKPAEIKEGYLALWEPESQWYREMLDSCWKTNPVERPTMGEILDTLSSRKRV